MLTCHVQTPLTKWSVVLPKVVNFGRFGVQLPMACSIVLVTTDVAWDRARVLVTTDSDRGLVKTD